MINFKATIERFGKKGEKTGWIYIEVPAHVSEKLNPGCKKAYRVSGKLDETEIKGVSLTPMGEGNFILALKSEIRKKLTKKLGDVLKVSLRKDLTDPPISEILLSFLAEDDTANTFFNTLAPSHQRYFSNWIDSAKTETTKARRIAMTLNALALGMSYGEMIRSNKTRNF